MDLKNQTQREIKFRALTIANNIMVYGDLLCCNNGERRIMFDNSGTDIEDNIFDVQPSTVGQFTGLTDKNGVEIYEWDVINHRYSEKGKNDYIIWDKNIMSFCLNDMSYENWANDEWYNTLNLEILGNIYQNPELLK